MMEYSHWSTEENSQGNEKSSSKGPRERERERERDREIARVMLWQSGMPCCLPVIGAVLHLLLHVQIAKKKKRFLRNNKKNAAAHIIYFNLHLPLCEQRIH